jgi:hypothetical protein
MMHTTFGIPRVERSDTESGNGLAHLELAIEPGNSFVVALVASEPGSARELTFDDQIVYPPLSRLDGNHIINRNPLFRANP